jgi:hypothetical protein
MVDSTSSRMRCRAVREIRTGQGLIRCFTEGVIQGKIDTHGRHLIRVQWDSGVTDYACPSEIEMLGQEPAPRTDTHERAINLPAPAFPIE